MMTITFEKKWIFVLILFQVSVILAALTGGMLADRYFRTSQEGFPILVEAYSILRNHALFELPDDIEIEYAMIRGMVNAVDDPYTNFIEPPQHELQSQQLAGEYGGIGARLEVNLEGYYLLYPYPESPAEKVGIMEGDRLVSVDGIEVGIDRSIDDIESALRGPEGQRVVIVVARQGQEDQLTFRVRREKISIPSVTWNIVEEDKRIGLVQVNLIAKSTPEEILSGVEDLQSRGAGSIILDLRNNTGGLVDAGVDIARLFLESGTVIEEKYRDKPVKQYAVERMGTLADLPVVILVNGGTASAAEIVAGSLQAQGRAVLIGTPTYGKNTIQLVFDLKDKSSLHVTAARWWIPGKEAADVSSIQPDVMMPENDIHSAAILHEAVKILVK
jgi:carboxyl-terminal processing protease